MGEVIGIEAAHQRREQGELYRQHLDDAIEAIEETAASLFTNAVNMAVSGPWRDWDATQSTGAKMEFTLEALGDTSDARLTTLANAIAHLRGLAVALRKP